VTRQLFARALRLVQRRFRAGRTKFFHSSRRGAGRYEASLIAATLRWLLHGLQTLLWLRGQLRPEPLP
jgi:hypothetical protein